MSQNANINLTMAEIAKMLCPKCKERLRSLVRDKITDKMVDQALGERPVES
jgi:uncharacterized protein with PIN domain